MLPITEFRVLETPDELVDWEAEMRERFHLEVSAIEAQGHSHTYCVTGEKPGWDDTDTDDPF